MSSSGSIGDPRTGRDRRVPTKTRTFKDGTLDPITEHRRPLLTWGNAILLAVMVGFGLYATGNFPQLDAFFDNLDKQARGRNDVVVHTLITYGTFLFGAVIFAVFCLFVFLFINSRRRQLSDPKGWHKVADRAPERRQRDRREDLPSMVMPIGKERPNRRTTDSPATTPVAAKVETPALATSPQPATPAQAVAPQATAKEAPPVAAPPNSAKAAAIAAAAKAEAELDATPADLPSFVMPLGKTKKPQAPPSPIEIAKIAATPNTVPVSVAAPATSTPEPTPAAATTPDTSTLAAAAASAKVDAAIAAAKAAAAKAEAAMAAAKAEAAIAEAAMAAAQAEAKSLTPTS
jgi:hypothetical protein